MVQTGRAQQVWLIPALCVICDARAWCLSWGGSYSLGRYLPGGVGNTLGLCTLQPAWVLQVGLSGQCYSPRAGLGIFTVW